MKRILLSLLAVMAISVSASAQTAPTFTTNEATVAPAEGWDGYDFPFAEAENVTVEVYGTDSVIVRNWAGTDGYDLCAVLTVASDTTISNVYGIENDTPSPYVSGYYYYVNGGGTDTNYTIWSYIYLPYSYVGLGEGGESGYLTLMGYYYKSEDSSSSVWGYYNITWGYDEDNTTGITSPVALTKATPAAAYNLAGQKVGSDYKGIVVQNGKKLIRK